MEAQLILLDKNKKNNKFLKTSLILAILLNLLILIFLLFYSLDQEHTQDFFTSNFPINIQDQSSDSLPVYFDMPGDPNGDPASVATTIENLSVGYDQDSGAPQNGAVSKSQTNNQQNSSKQEPSFGFDDIDGVQDEKQSTPDKSQIDPKKNLQEQKKSPGINNLVKDLKAVSEDINNQESIEVLEEKIKNLENSLESNLEENLQDNLDLAQIDSGYSDLSLWQELNPQKSKINKKQVAQENYIQEQESKIRTLPKKSGSIFGKQLLEGFKNFMNEQRYAQADNSNNIDGTSSQYDSNYSGQYNNYNSSNNSGNSNNSGISGAQLGRALTSQLKGEINGMLLIKELALASRLDNTMVQSDKFINKNIPFELTIGENGKVLNVELKESCGVHDIDRHFIKLVYQASPINHYARHYKGSPFKISLNIRFVVPAGANRLLVTYGDQY